MTKSDVSAVPEEYRKAILSRFCKECRKEGLLFCDAGVCRWVCGSCGRDQGGNKRAGIFKPISDGFPKEFMPEWYKNKYGYDANGNRIKPDADNR